MIEVCVVSIDAVVLIGIRLLPEKDVLLLQSCAEEHGLLVMNVVVLSAVKHEVLLVAEPLQVWEDAAVVVAPLVVVQ